MSTIAAATEGPQPVTPVTKWIFGVAIFLSAFLLFQVQLILGKFLLPWFGGTTAVWTTCMLFYQVVLLAGYAYAHGLARLAPKIQGSVHLLLLLAGASLLAWHASRWGTPLLPNEAWEPAPDAAPVAGILTLLVVSIGLPLFALSATAPLLQHWVAILEQRKDAPLYLYALSNAGSLLGLATYPSVFEPLLRLRAQSALWGAAFFLFLVCCGLSAILSRRARTTPHEIDGSKDKVGAARAALWFMLSACGSLLLLSTTNHLTQDVAPVPLLWTLPLCIYLLSFIVVFHKESWYPRGFYHPLFLLSSMAGLFALLRGGEMPVLSQILTLSILLFAGCMVCHGELVRLKPSSAHLTAFYLTISAGGAAGGLFVSLIAPLVFPDYWEYPLGLFLAATLLLVILYQDRESWMWQGKAWMAPAVFAGVLVMPAWEVLQGRIQSGGAGEALLFVGLAGSLLSAFLWATAPAPAWLRQRDWTAPAVALALTTFGLGLILQVSLNLTNVVAQWRNFYGTLAVREQLASDRSYKYLELLHGNTVHGVQARSGPLVQAPTTYYTVNGGAGLAIMGHPQATLRGLKVGTIGLGIGTLAAYARPQDDYRFYEINPKVIALAAGENGYFTYMSSSRAHMAVVPGDARLSLEAEARRSELQQFDVLLVDAFNSDSVPVHLLTEEAMRLYLRHLRGPDSVIGVHISNRSVDLEPVVAGLARRLDLRSRLVLVGTNPYLSDGSRWVLLSPGRGLETPAILAAGRPTSAADPSAPLPLWTDDHNNILSLMLSAAAKGEASHP
ncbi:MAG: ferrichrome ABC transporter permease [Acidobacteriales bacterium]|nr:ferrichrome ABC transporter permease [Terriglobales bacterium]